MEHPALNRRERESRKAKRRERRGESRVILMTEAKEKCEQQIIAQRFQLSMRSRSRIIQSRQYKGMDANRDVMIPLFTGFESGSGVAKMSQSSQSDSGSGSSATDDHSFQPLNTGP